ncbi:unnamed protein product [Porites evermanni]|uniref:Uncharacterized protein n=1 Tax=Porites evermanni TaxID=104178 RepID=A0ABN8LRU7_9CNID|nr:unnamed protein product [Porites evermanni]
MTCRHLLRVLLKVTFIWIRHRHSKTSNFRIYQLFSIFAGWGKVSRATWDPSLLCHCFCQIFSFSSLRYQIQLTPSQVCSTNSLLINPEKTKFIVVGLPPLTSQLPPVSLTVLGISAFPKDCNSLPPHLPSGVYIIQPLADEEPIDVYCEMAINGGGFTFLPRGLTRTLHADLIVNALFRDRKNVLLKLKKRVDLSESYTLIQPHPNFAHTEFGVLVNSFAGYTEPINAFMKDYILLGIIPASAVRNGSEGFISNGNIIQFSNCDGTPHSYFAFFPNYNLEPPSNRSDSGGVADIWRSKVIAINYTDHNMPDEFFFLTEVHFGGCGTYSSSDQWTKYGFNATAIGIR